MPGALASMDAPSPSAIEHVFLVYETEIDGEEIRYYGTPRAPMQEVVQEVWELFREAGYDVRLTRELGEWILVAEPVSLGVDGIPWTNLILGIATLASTLFAGSMWYHIDPFSPQHSWLDIIHAWPFAAAIMFVLGVHEFGHYLLSRYHRVDASLPYFIPVPTLIGTMGAVIRMKGQIPSRRALFDIGVAGPLAGFVATVIVTVVGLHLPPVEAPAELVADPNAIAIELGYPPLLEFLAWAVDQPLVYESQAMAPNPVVIAGWVGMFVTFLNLIPVGQLDGGHILRSILGQRQGAVATLVPLGLFGLAGYVYVTRDVSVQAVAVWAVWGVLTTVFLAVGSARPINDRPIGRGRVLVGIVTFGLGLLCFTPVPIDVAM